MAGALKKITTRAKQIYAKGGTWKAAIKKAGAEYRGSKKKKPARKRRVSGTLSAGASNGVGRVKRRRKVSGIDSSFATAAFSGVKSTAHHIAAAKQTLAGEIGILEVKKFKAVKKSDKNKIAKKIAAKKTQYRKLC
jgi:hypothetical protein